MIKQHSTNRPYSSNAGKLQRINMVLFCKKKHEKLCLLWSLVSCCGKVIYFNIALLSENKFGTMVVALFSGTTFPRDSKQKQFMLLQDRQPFEETVHLTASTGHLTAHTVYQTPLYASIFISTSEVLQLIQISIMAHSIQYLVYKVVIS